MTDTNTPPSAEIHLTHAGTVELHKRLRQAFPEHPEGARWSDEQARPVLEELWREGGWTRAGDAPPAQIDASQIVAAPDLEAMLARAYEQGKLDGRQELTRELSGAYLKACGALDLDAPVSLDGVVDQAAAWMRDALSESRQRDQDYERGRRDMEAKLLAAFEELTGGLGLGIDRILQLAADALEERRFVFSVPEGCRIVASVGPELSGLGLDMTPKGTTEIHSAMIEDGERERVMGWSSAIRSRGAEASLPNGIRSRVGQEGRASGWAEVMLEAPEDHARFALDGWLAGGTQRWHSHVDPRLRGSVDRVDGHSARLAILALQIWGRSLAPDQLLELLIWCLTHDLGESGAAGGLGDINGGADIAAELKELLGKAESEALASLHLPLPDFGSETLLRGKMLDRLDAYLWMLQRAPKRRKHPFWMRCKKRIQRTAEHLDCRLIVDNLLRIAKNMGRGHQKALTRPGCAE